MIRRLAFLVLALAPHGPIWAETARVYSGEHPDFTRLVVEMPAPADWVLGRTATGYAFATKAADQPAYDVSEIWARIPKTRLQAVAVDPANGALQLTLACDCHVFPFEYRPGVVVLDVKPGPAPQGSSFEAAFDPPAAAPLSTPAAQPALRYDWLDQAKDLVNPPPRAEEIALPAGAVSLVPLRDELLEQLSRGAAQGIVEMVMPGKPVQVAPVDRGILPWSQIYIGPPPDVRLDAQGDSRDSRTPDGSACIPDNALALADWGKDGRPLDLLAEARSSLYGEFDLVDADAVERAVKLHLYLGFGAEAAQYARLLQGPDAPDDLPHLQSLAILVDGGSDPASPFQGMLTCDGAVAFWALMAEPSVRPDMAVNTDAVVRSFLALPAHLRGAMGTAVADRLLALGDAEAARIVRNAIKRTPDVPVATVALLDARADLHAGKAATAIDHAQVAISEDGTGTAEWITLVEAHFQKLQPMTPEAAEALHALAGEVQADETAHEFHRALALAEVLSGQTDAGFQTATAHAVPLSDIWQVAVALAGDEAFLRQAITSDPLPAAQIAPDTADRIADRLVNLGFPDAALAWLEPTEPADGPEKRRIAARAELARSDARQALALLAGLDAPEDAVLRARALVQLGQLAEARAAYQAAGLTDEALQLAAWERAWPDLKAAEAPLWSTVLDEMDQPPGAEPGPLARGAAILESTASSRTAIDALLSGIAPPEPETR